MRLLLLFLFFISSLRADWDQLFSDNEDPTLFHHVNVITGNLNLCLEDGVIEGAKSLPIFRTYSSVGALEPPHLNAELKTEQGGWAIQGGWNFLPHTNLWIDLTIKPKHFRIYLPEPGGNLIAYSYNHNKSDHVLIFQPEKGFGQCSGNLSAKTNAGNNVLELHLKKGIAILFLPNGGSRIYKGKNFHHWDIRDWRGRRNERRLKCRYRLSQEVLPSQHKIHYSYDHHDRLKGVALMNPSETKTFSWMNLDLIKKDSPFVLGLKTSDGKSFQYKAMEFKETDYICSVHSSHRAEEGIAYIQGRKGIGARIRRMDLGGKFQFEARYYTPPNKKKEEKWAEEPEKKHFETDKVHFLEAPIGPHREIIPFAQFSYRPGVTEVRNSANHLTRYTHDAGHLSSIEYCNERDEVVSILKFIWEGDRLKAKAMLDGQHRAHFSKVFHYDAAGNVIHETLWGSLTGAIEGPFFLNGDGSLAHAEHYSKRYEYLPRFNIPILEGEENGLTYTYTYKNDTDLPTAKFTSYGGKILTREFLFYNEDNLLIAEITDDGDSSDPNDLNHVTERQIKRYDLDSASGLIRSLTEFYLDRASHSEIPLRKVGYSYSPEHRVITEAVFDAEGIHRYTIHTDYDPQGHVIRKTTPLSQENIYSYDSLGNLLFAKEVSHPGKTFTYDPAGRPASVEESDHLGTIKKTFTIYDAHGNLLSQTDPKGNTTEQLYDAFGRCTRTQFPTALDQEGSPYTPVVTFAFDLQGNLSSTSIQEGGTTQTLYNTLRKPVKIIQADGSVICHRYFKDGTLAQTIQPDGTHIDYLYDMFQRMISKKIYSAEGELLSAESWAYNAFHLLSYTDPNGLATHYTYDGAGRKIAEQAESKVIAYTYDSLGFLEKTIESAIAHVQIHDIGGRVIEEWKESSDGRIENHMRFSYDAENRKIQAVRTTSQGEATDLFFYDRESRLTRHIDPEGNPTEFLYTEETNPLGQGVLQKTTIDPRGNSTIETHDALNRVTGRIQKDSHGNTVSKEELFYDKAGNQARRISTVYHDHTPKSQTSVRWEYDLMGRVITESEGSDKTTRFAYDERGRVIRRLLPSGISVDSLYDGIDRIIETKSSDGTIHYQYAYANGCPDPVEVADLVHHTLLQREYNAFGQILKEINPYGLTFTWQYDHHGRCTAYTLPDLSSIAYLYKGGHLIEVSRLSAYCDLLYTHHYCDFDPNGHVAQEKFLHNIGNLHTSHDLLERPIRQHSPWLSQTISYGPSSLVTQTHNSLLGDKIYAHDALNQLVREGDEQYAFDSLGNPIHCSINEYNQITSGPDYSLDYDRNGNPVRKMAFDGITVYSYDAFNRLISITHPDSKKTVYFYDSFSRLIAEQNDGVQTLYLYDKTQEIGAMNAHGIAQLKVIGLGLQGEIGGSVAIEIEGIAYAPLHDFQGNIIALISADQKIVESYLIDAFGREKNDFVPLSPWRFSSKRSMGKLIFFGQRFYDPTLGRWLTPDPSGFADGSNLYVYVLNSPLNRLDLFGLASDLFPPDLRLEVPLHAILPARVVPISSILPCKGFLSDVPVDWVVSCGHWHKLQFTPQEWKTDTVNIVDHFHELVPKEGSTIGLITTQNGICTTRNDLIQNVQSIVNMVPEGTLTFGMYNPTHGLIEDCKRTFQERGGKDTPVVVSTRQYMVAISETLHKINPDLLWLHIAHSEGGVVGRNAIKGMTEDQKDLLKNQLYVLGVAPAKPIPLEFGKGVTNIYSKQDFITGAFALKYKNDPKYDIRFVSCRSTFSERTAYFADHAFLGGTYQGEQLKYIDRLRQKQGFYSGSAR